MTTFIFYNRIVRLDILNEKAKELADKLRESDEIHIVSHIDADGITSASIAYEALKRLGKNASFEFVKQLEKDKIKGLRKEKRGLTWFTDLGSGQIDQLDDFDCIITDHHEPSEAIEDPSIQDRGNILSYCRPSILEFNPHHHGVDGANEISGAGMTYLVAEHLGDNIDLTKLAVVGAVGDLQASEHGKLIGKNREILEKGVSEGYICVRKDTIMYGLETRPISKVLEYASNPSLPGLSGDGNACIDFLDDLGISMKVDGEWKRWYQLSKEEKKTILSAVAEKMLNFGYPSSYIDSLFGEVYTFPDEEEGTMVHEAKEFSTLLNSCGRYKKGKIGLKVCLGDRDEYYDKAMQLLKGHQKVLVDCLKTVEDAGIIERKNLQYFHGGDRIPDTVLGTVAGMILGSGDVDRNLPIIGFAETEDREGVKVSSRGTKDLVEKGLDLSEVMSTCSAAVGGEGGGHDIAAGAFIPEGEEEEFIRKVEEMIEKQLS